MKYDQLHGEDGHKGGHVFWKSAMPFWCRFAHFPCFDIFGLESFVLDGSAMLLYFAGLYSEFWGCHVGRSLRV